MKNSLKTIVIICALSITTLAIATTYPVNSQTSFNTAKNAAGANDTIEWQSGTYSDIYIYVSQSNLVIKAKTLGGTVFNGASRANITGNYITLEGFQYIGGNIGTNDVIRSYGSYNTFTQINIKDYTSYKYLVIYEECQYDTVSYCNFESRANYADKNILSVLVDNTNPGYHGIKYCSFKNFIGDGIGSAGDDGVEPIRIGVSSQGEYISHTTVEYCYFTQCNGDGEIISNKSKQNVFRYNTFENNPESELVLRHGDEGVVYGNFFLNGMGGVRIKEGQGHVVFNNYFSGLTSRAINLSNYSVDPLDSITIAYNTFVESAEIQLGSSGSYPPAHITFANNIFTQPTYNLFESATGTETWIGNIYNGSLGITEPASGLTSDDPVLEINSEGYYSLASTSPAIDAAEKGYPALPDFTGMNIDNDVLLDIMKQARPSDTALKDLGCSEYPHSTIIQPMATEDNTGPIYLMPSETKMLTVNNTGFGTVTLNPPTGLYLTGTEITLTAEPSTNNTFIDWNGDLSGTTNPQTIIMDDDKTITANFTSIVSYTLDYSTTGSGSITLDPPTGPYTSGTTVTLTAIPDANNTFNGWSGDLSGSTNPETIVMDDNKTITVNFVADGGSSIDNTSTLFESVKLFPNPVRDKINLSFTQHANESVKIVLFDLSGRKVKTINEHLSAGNHTLNYTISDLSSGAYILYINQANNQSTQILKLIKE